MNRRRIQTLLPFLLLFLISTNFDYLYKFTTSPSPSDPVTAYVSLKHLTQRLTLEQKPLFSPPVTESILFTDWIVFVLLPTNLSSGDRYNISCLFSNGATSAANYSGRVPSSARDGFICEMPRSVQRLRPFYTPKLVSSGSVIIGSGLERVTEMMRWNRLAYESMSTVDDVIVFVKGLNRNQDRDRPARDITCVFSVNGAVVAVTNATLSAQEVFRCPHPSVKIDGGDIRVSVKIAGESAPIPSVAGYKRSTAQDTGETKKSLMCACTMVYNVAKFLREWVSFHSAIGVDKFVLYDNGSDDDLIEVLTQLADEGYDISSIYWPWQKTQEAGFSHFAAAAHVSGACAWTAFLDVDEFLYSPSWAKSARPKKTMIRSVIGPDSPTLGQVQLTCVDFGPSGQRAHPAAGVTQGYTCLMPTSADQQRHKSIVRLSAVGPALKNSVHHFEVGPGWKIRRVRAHAAVVNHYKYQAWGEFRKKFRLRVSAYVADWREKRNVGSRDRVPGLGFSEDVEPEWWGRKGCERRDEGLKRVVGRWFRGENGRFGWEI